MLSHDRLFLVSYLPILSLMEKLVTWVKIIMRWLRLVPGATVAEEYIVHQNANISCSLHDKTKANLKNQTKMCICIIPYLHGKLRKQTCSL